MRVRPCIFLLLAAAVLSCAALASADPALALRTAKPAPSGAPVPWLALGGIAAAIVSCLAARSDWRATLRQAAVVSGFGLVVLAVRWLILPRAFFHQNGHGPLWVQYALDDDLRASPYGPGFGELFGAAARATGADPERGLFLLQALLGAAVPPLAFVMARSLGATRLAAGALAGAIAFDPLLGRLAQSESYFGAQCVLGFAAAAALAHAARRPSPRSLTFIAGVIAAGFFVAQAARVHPVGFIPLALLPIVVAIGPGGPRRRIRATIAAGLGIAVLVAITSGPELIGVLQGSLGRQWLPGAKPHLYMALQGAAPIVLVLAVVLGAVLRSARGAVLSALAGVVLVVMYATDLLGAPNAAVDGAYDRLFWPVLAALAGAWLARVARPPKRRRLVPALVIVSGATLAVARFSALTELPTDALEASFAIEWRKTLPEGALVVYVERAEKQIARLPLYDGVSAARALPIVVDDRERTRFSDLAGDVYYYRSTLCTTAAARASCAALEQGLELEPLAARELPARPSMRWHPYGAELVRVELSRSR